MDIAEDGPFLGSAGPAQSTLLHQLFDVSIHFLSNAQRLSNSVTEMCYEKYILWPKPVNI